MISIIICSNSKKRQNQICENISLTCSVPHEIIIYDATDGSAGLAKAYNQSAATSKFEILCFVHDDVLFHTKDWGNRIINHLEDKNTGIIGVMGGRYKSRNGLTWRDGETQQHRYNIKDGLENGKHLQYNPLLEPRSEVLCLDGAFLCCRKEVWEQCKFDEETFSGFHFYDADICMQALQHYKNYVVYDVLIEHFSHGTLHHAFIKNAYLFEEKWKNKLPVCLDKISKNKFAQLEGYALAEKLIVMKKAGVTFNKRWMLITKYFYKYRNLYHLIRTFYFGILKN